MLAYSLEFETSASVCYLLLLFSAGLALLVFWQQHRSLMHQEQVPREGVREGRGGQEGGREGGEALLRNRHMSYMPVPCSTYHSRTTWRLVRATRLSSPRAR